MRGGKGTQGTRDERESERASMDDDRANEGRVERNGLAFPSSERGSELASARWSNQAFPPNIRRLFLPFPPASSPPPGRASLSSPSFPTLYLLCSLFESPILCPLSGSHSLVCLLCDGRSPSVNPPLPAPCAPADDSPSVPPPVPLPSIPTDESGEHRETSGGSGRGGVSCCWFSCGGRKRRRERGKRLG